MPVTDSSAACSTTRPRFEDEEVQPPGHAGHLAQDAIEHDGQERADRQRRQIRRLPTSSADSHNRFAAIRRRGKPSARSAATSPSRWFTDMVSSVAMSRNANASVIDERTVEICRK